MSGVAYSSGQVGKAINAENGTGFVYYPDGKVACSVATASDYQNSHYAFDRSKKSTLLLALDEQLVGCITSTSRKTGGALKADGSISVTTMVLSKVGGILTVDAVIKNEWVWSKQPVLEETVSIALNEYLAFSIRSRESAALVFSCEGITHSMELSVKQKRTAPSYLQTAQRSAGGKIIPSLPNHQTLKQRTIDFNTAMQAQNNKIHPKSANLSPLVSGIVAGLEGKFDGVDSRMACSPGPGVTWKSDALSATLREIPRLPLSGNETGAFAGFGKDIYTDMDGSALRELQKKMTPAHLLGASGAWKNDLDVSRALKGLNPVLKDSKVLKYNSGKYSPLMVANPALVTPINPQGLVVLHGKPLEVVKWEKLREYTVLNKTGKVWAAAGPSSSSGNSNSGSGNDRGSPYGNDVLLCLVTRTGDPAGGECERVAEVANMTPVPGVRLCRIDVGDCSSILEEMEVRYLPMFLALAPAGGVLRCIYSGSLGGRKIGSSGSGGGSSAADSGAGAGSSSGGGGGGRPQVLLIESKPRHQLFLEKVLRKESCDSFLCFTVGQASERCSQLSQMASTRPNGSRTEIVFDLVLISAEEDLSELGALLKKLQQHTSTGRTVVAGLVSVLGVEGEAKLAHGKWDPKTLTSTNFDALLPAPLAAAATLAVQKPLKAASIAELMSRVVRFPGAASGASGGEVALNMGLTPQSLLVRAAALRDGAVSAAAAAGAGGASGLSGSQFNSPLKLRRIPLAVDDFKPPR